MIYAKNRLISTFLFGNIFIFARYTKDNKLVTFHDDDLKRMAGLDKLVSNLTLEELQDLILHTDYNCIKCKNRFIE